jgi:uncharacterized protein
VKFILLNTIRLYWFLIPKAKRRKCIFNKSCSNQVYDALKLNGLKSGLKELNFRIKNCQPQFDVFTDYKTGRKKMILKTGIVVDEDQIAERLK